jgi:hypothetical protein
LVVGQSLNAQELHPSDLTANDLAEALSVHWWTVKLPHDLKPKDMVGVEAISSDGKRLEGSGGFSAQTGVPIGDTMRIYCWEDKASHLTNIVMKTSCGTFTMFLKDYFKGAALAAQPNGAVLNVGDILLNFDSSKSPSFSGVNLSKGQVGLRVVITPHK